MFEVQIAEFKAAHVCLQIHHFNAVAIFVLGFLLLNYLMFITLMPCLYVLLCGPKIRNKDSCLVSCRTNTNTYYSQFAKDHSFI